MTNNNFQSDIILDISRTMHGKNSSPLNISKEPHSENSIIIKTERHIKGLLKIVMLDNDKYKIKRI